MVMLVMVMVTDPSVPGQLLERPVQLAEHVVPVRRLVEAVPGKTGGGTVEMAGRGVTTETHKINICHIE